MTHIIVKCQGRNHSLKVEGKGLGLNTGALVLRAAVFGQTECWVREGVAPPAVRVRGITTGKFLKTQMLNPAFW